MKNYIDKICPFCNAEIKDDDIVKVCPDCGIPHHEECWMENKGCTTHGCSEQLCEAKYPKPSVECQKCGTSLIDDQAFCPNYGQKSGLAVDTGASNTNKAKKKRKTRSIIISIILAIVLIAVAAVLYVTLYKIPHDEAVRQYNEAVDKYNSAVEQFSTASTALEERNKALDDSIANLGKIVYAENLPIDEFLLAEANSVLTEARSVTKDTAPTLSEMPQNTDEINAEADNILALISDVEAMGDYSDTIDLLTATEEKYQKIIDEFQGCKTEVVWTGVDEIKTLLRFAVKIRNDNDYAMRGVATEWIAYDKNDAIVGAYTTAQTDIPANGHIYYVGGAGGANLSGTPVRVEVKVKTDGILTNRKIPQITVSNAQTINEGWGIFKVTADCVTDSEIMTANLSGEIIVKDAEGQIITAEFWSTDNLPDTIPAGGKFILSEYLLDLSAIPVETEVYMYYVWQ